MTSDIDREPDKVELANEEPPTEQRARGLSSKFRWLVESQRRRLLLPASGLWIFALDWLLFSSNLLSLGLATPIVVCLGFLLGSAGTFYLQSRFAGERKWLTAVKALFAGIVVGVPWPLTGTLIGGWVLFLSGLGKLQNKAS